MNQHIENINFRIEKSGSTKPLCCFNTHPKPFAFWVVILYYFWYLMPIILVNGTCTRVIVHVVKLTPQSLWKLNTQTFCPINKIFISSICKFLRDNRRIEYSRCKTELRHLCHIMRFHSKHYWHNSKL